jgi:hypothetical protein
MGPNSGQSDRKIDGFGDVVVRAQTKGLDDVFPPCSCRDHDDWKLGLGAVNAKQAQHLEATRTRHLDVKQNKVERILIDERQRLWAIRSGRDEKTLMPEPPGKDVSIVFVVVDDE